MAFPTRVGMNRPGIKFQERVPMAFPTRVGMNRAGELEPN